MFNQFEFPMTITVLQRQTTALTVATLAHTTEYESALPICLRLQLLQTLNPLRKGEREKEEEKWRKRKRKRNRQRVQESALTTIPTTMPLNTPPSKPTATTSSRPTATISSTSKVHLEACHFSQINITVPPALRSDFNLYIRLYDNQHSIATRVLGRSSQHRNLPLLNEY